MRRCCAGKSVSLKQVMKSETFIESFSFGNKADEEGEEEVVRHGGKQLVKHGHDLLFRTGMTLDACSFGILVHQISVIDTG